MPLLAILALQASSADAALAHLRAAESLLANAPSLRAAFVRDDLGGGDYSDLRQTGRVEAARSGGVSVRIDRARRVREGEPWRDTGNATLAVGDGKRGYDVFFHAHSTQVRAARPSLDSVPPLAGFFAGTAAPSGVVERAERDGSLREVRLGARDLEFDTAEGHFRAEFDAAGLLRRYVVTTPKGRTQDWRIETLALGAKPTPGVFVYSPPADALPYDRATASAVPGIGEAAPDFALSDLGGRTLRLSELRGKVVVLEFFATWCWPCNQALPAIGRTVDALSGEDVVRVAVAIRAGRKDLDAWTKAHPALGSFRFLFEDPRTPTVSTRYGVSTTPSSFVIGRDGRVVTASAGFSGSTDALRAAVASALGEPTR